MDTIDSNWSIGETATLSRSESLLKKHGGKSYSLIADSRYVCVREASEGQRGILVKVLGDVSGKDIVLVDDEPFCMDIREDFYTKVRYYSYPFPTTDELKKILELIRRNQSLMKAFEEASMRIDPGATFWVHETAGHLAKKLQYYDAATDKVCKAADDTAHCRLTVAYFPSV